MTWAFVPLKPKELTPARRFRSPLEPFFRFAGNFDLQAAPVDVRIHFLEVQMARNFAVLQRQDDFDQSSYAGGGFEMAEVGFYGADDKRFFARAGCASGSAKDFREGVSFDGIAEFGAGSVGFDVVDFGGRDGGFFEGGANDVFLSFAVGRGESGAAAVLIDRGAAQDGENVVAIGDRIRKALQDDDCAAFAADEAVGARIESFAAAVGSHHVRFGKRDSDFRRQDGVDAAGESEAAFIGAETLRGKMNGDERSGAGGVDGDARPLQAESVGDAAGGDAVRGAGGEVRVDGFFAAFEKHGVIVGGGDADKNASGRGEKFAGRVAGVLERFPADFEKEALLRIHVDRFAAGDREKGRVEKIDAGQSGGEFGGGAARFVGIGVEVRGRVPAVGGNFGDGVGAVREERPEAVGTFAGAGNAATDTDDGDGLVLLRAAPGPWLCAARSRSSASSFSSLECSSRARSARRLGESFSMRSRKSLIEILPNFV